MYVWDEGKRRSNLVKHGLDFHDAYLVYENPGKCTYASDRNEEQRHIDLALVEVRSRVLALIYSERGQDIRVISFRPASRQERQQYEKDSE